MAAVTSCVSVSDRCRPLVFENEKVSVIDDVTVPDVCIDTHTMGLD